MNIDNYDKEELSNGDILLKKKPAVKDWNPSQGRCGFSVFASGEVNKELCPTSQTLLLRHKRHCTFETEAQAKKAEQLQIRSNAVIRACILVDPDFEPDWNNHTQDKYYPFSSCISWMYSSTTNCLFSPAYVSSYDKVKEVCALLTKWGA